MRFQRLVTGASGWLNFLAALAAVYGVKAVFIEWFGTNSWVNIFAYIIGFFLCMVIMATWHSETDADRTITYNRQEMEKYEKLFYAEQAECIKLRNQLAKANAAEAEESYEELYIQYFNESLRLERLLRDNGINSNEQD